VQQRKDRAGMDSPTENPSARTEDLKRKPTNLFAPKLKSRADSTGPRLDASTKENERDTKTSSKSRAREQQKKITREKLYRAPAPEQES
jgi:hypothetical protein